jgi:hypothetical protein
MRKDGVYFDGSNTTNRILDVLEQERPKVICIDELDKMPRELVVGAIVGPLIMASTGSFIKVLIHT